MNFKKYYFEEENLDSKINSLLDNHDFTLFFKKDNEIFGSKEEGRVVFAKLKTSDSDVPDGWFEEANFSADNLSRLINGEESTHLFGKKDLSKIKVLDRNKAFDELKKIIKNKDFCDSTKLNKTKQVANFIQAVED